jgi:hypothetical protein
LWHGEGSDEDGRCRDRGFPVTKANGRESSVEAARWRRLIEKFWAKYLARMQEEYPDWSGVRKPSAQNWMDFRSPIKGTALNPSFAHGNRLRHEIYIGTGDSDRNVEIFGALLEQRAALEATYGRPLDFEELPTARGSRIAEYLPDVDVRDEERHEEFIDWILDAGERLRRALEAVSVA